MVVIEHLQIRITLDRWRSNAPESCLPPVRTNTLLTPRNKPYFHQPLSTSATNFHFTELEGKFASTIKTDGNKHKFEVYSLLGCHYPLIQFHFPEQNPELQSVKTQNSQAQSLMCKCETRHLGGSENIGVWKYAVHGQKKWRSLSSSMCNTVSFDILNMDTSNSSQMFVTINQTT
jgi:hypothetical protein